jgi:uncharacterized membrane protein (UPF0182 family)
VAVRSPFAAARPRLLIPVVLVLVAMVIVATVYVRLYTDFLFFRSVDSGSVYNTILGTRILLFVLFGLLMGGIVGANLVIAYVIRPPFRPLSPEQQSLERYRLAIEPYLRPLVAVIAIAFGLLAGASASGRWRTWLLWRNGQQFGVDDPQFGRDISYYAFTYPFQRFLLGFLFTAVVLSLLVATVTHYLFGGIRLQTQGEKVTARAKVHLSVLLGVFVLLKAAAYYLDRFGLVFSPRGVVTGASYTDVKAVLPAKTILLVISLLCAILFFANISLRGWALPSIAFGLLVLSALVIGGLYPAFIQQFRVKPNEVSREAPYIARNIEATRIAYGLNDARYETYNATDQVTAALRNDTGTIPNARLLDPNQLRETYEQLQRIRFYYGFPATLDIDRYTVNGETRDYVVSAREVDQSGLQTAQRNWINQHLAFTHGHGFVAAPADRPDANGEPNFLVRNVPPLGPEEILGDPERRQTRVYFGELSPEYSVVNTKQKEIDGPGSSDQEQATFTYDGDGGVSIGSTWRKVLFALRYQEKNLLLSGDLTGDSRILYEREPRQRVLKVAPWLTVDSDPFPAMVGGRLLWILDGYTTSDGFPYSERRPLRDITADAVTTRADNRQQQRPETINYIRNSVKATVDAYDGTVTLYAYDERDPVLRTWRKAFPGIVKSRAELDRNRELSSHLRYPEDLFKAQRDLLTSYHVNDPRAFYSREDFWSVPDDPTTEGTSDQPPYYVLSQLPGQTRPSFNLTAALNARGRPNAAAVLVVSADDQNPRLRVLRLPRDTVLNGPTQVQNDINATTRVSQELNLLRQGGSRVVLGNLLTLPVGGGLLYVEPVYVQASGDQGFPVLRRVIVVFGKQVGFGNTLDEALRQVFEGGTATTPPTGTPTSPPTGGPTATPTRPPPAGTLEEAIQAAQRAFDAGEAALARRPPDFAAYDAAQDDLRAALARIAALSGRSPSPDGSPSPTGTASPPATRSPSPSPSPSPAASPAPQAAPTPSPG